MLASRPLITTILKRAACLGLIAFVAVLVLAGLICGTAGDAQSAEPGTQLPAVSNEKVVDEAESAPTSRIWEILRQPNTMGLFHGLPQRVENYLSSRRTDAVSEGVADPGSLLLKIEVEGDAAGDIKIAFFNDPRWWVAAPALVRSFARSGEFEIHDLPPGKFYLGALIGGLPRPLALGVHETWPAPVEIAAGKTAKTRVLVSTRFHWATQVKNTRDFTGNWPKMDPSRLITVRTVDDRGEPVPFCRVTIVRRDPQTTFDLHQLGTDERGFAYSDAIAGTFSVLANREDFDPETLAVRAQWMKIEKLHDPADHPVITIRWEPLAAGKGLLVGRVHNQHGAPIEQFFLDVSHIVGERRDWSDAHGVILRMPVVDRNGRFEVRGLAAGACEVTAHAFDYQTYVDEQNSQRKFTISEEPGAVTEANVQLDARELYYGRAVHLDGAPVRPGGWSAPLQANEGRGGATNPDGTFRVELSARELELLVKNNEGMIEVYRSRPTEVRGKVRITRLSRDRAKPARVVLPRAPLAPDSGASPAEPEVADRPDDPQDVAALRTAGGALKSRRDGTISEIGCLDSDIADDDFIHLRGTPSVVKLVLQRTRITDAGLVHLRGLTKLQRLDLRGVKMTDAGLEHLKDLTGLQLLDLGSTRVTDAGLKNLERLTSLKELHLDGINITDAGLRALRGLTRLEKLVLNGAPITDEGLESLAELSKIRHLGLINSRITDSGLLKLMHCTKLEELSLGAVAITDEGAEHLSAFTELKTLNLLNSAITDEGLAALKPLKNLRYIAISRNITDEGLVHLKDFPKLEGITLPCPSISDAGLVHIEEMRQLTNLQLYGSGVSDKGISRLMGLKNLINVDLRNTNVTEAGMKELRSLPRLTYIQGP